MRVDETIIFRARRATVEDAIEAAKAALPDLASGKLTVAETTWDKALGYDTDEFGDSTYEIWCSPNWRGYDGS